MVSNLCIVIRWLAVVSFGLGLFLLWFYLSGNAEKAMPSWSRFEHDVSTSLGVIAFNVMAIFLALAAEWFRDGGRQRPGR